MAKRATLRNLLVDRFRLIIAALLVFAGMMTFLFATDTSHISREVTLLVLFLGLFSAATFSEVFREMKVRKVKNKRFGIVLLAILQMIVIVLVLMSFYLRFFTMPTRGILIVGVVFTGIAVITLAIFRTLLDKLTKKGKIALVQREK